jgi:hypothetical protein
MAPKTIKFTDAQEWARLALIAGLKIGAGDAQDIVDANYQEHGEDGIEEHITGESVECFRPKPVKKSRAEKDKNSSERSTGDFNPEKCAARVWNHGFGAQCSRKCLEQGKLCKAHQKTKDAIPEGDDLKHGYFDQERPLFMLTAGDNIEKGGAIAWADLKEEMKAQKVSEKKAKTSEKKKKKSSPKKAAKVEPAFPRPKGRGPKGKKWDYDSGEWTTTEQVIKQDVDQEVAAAVKDIVQEVAENQVADEEICVAASMDGKNLLEEDSSPDEGVGTGLVEAAAEKDLEVEDDEVADQEVAEQEEKKEEDDDETIEFEGVKYIFDDDSRELYTVDDMELIGTWDGQTIDWEDQEEGPKMHEASK